MTAPRENGLVRLYSTRIGTPRSPAEVYGYWLVVLGLVAAVAGVGVFLAGSTAQRGVPAYWALREVGIVLVASSLPLAVFGVTLRLPLQPAAAAVGAFGALVCAAAVVWFVALYPFAWTFAGPQLPILTYTGGIVLLGSAVTLVPLAAAPTPADGDPDAVGHPYYELTRTSEGWTWLLYSSDGIVLAESADSFSDRTDARAALDRLSMRAPTAAIEVTTPTEA
jgi:hypothetical protein